MSKDGAKIAKIVGKKKINKYSKSDCESELARLATEFKDKDGNIIPDANSKYQQDIRKRLSVIS